jgi:hypothetical protein
VKKRTELIEMISNETELLDACAAWAEGKTEVERRVKASKIATALRALLSGAPKPRTDPARARFLRCAVLPFTLPRRAASAVRH